jgi:hypothetical protein
MPDATSPKANDPTNNPRNMLWESRHAVAVSGGSRKATFGQSDKIVFQNNGLFEYRADFAPWHNS